MIPTLARPLAALSLFVAGASFSAPALRAQASSATQAGQVAVPDSPAGRALHAWLDAFNSGDAAKLNAYYQRYEPAKSADGQMGFREQTGGFELLSVEKNEPQHVEFLVKERKGETRALGALDVGDGDQGGVKNFVLLALPPRGSVADFRIDAATRDRVIEGAIAKLNESYVFPETATKMGDAVRARQKRGEYNAVTNGATFASMLTEDLQEVSHDKHLRVNFSPARVPDNQGAPPPDAVARNRRRMEQINCGFVKVEQLAGNVGYVKFNMFADPDVCGPTATAAMNFVANSDALIIDLRDNGGGAPKMVAYICSYLFSQRTHLNDLWTRRTNTTEEFWTSEVPGKRLGDNRPVYVLTSKRTFSGAEEFTYNLKNLKRATIVGETTGGGAHPVSGQRIDEHFIIGVPFARAINPISKTNWEGTGVEPDVKVPAAEALTTAQKLASEKKPTTH
jgi:retinol-binding protein 3